MEGLGEAVGCLVWAVIIMAIITVVLLITVSGFIFGWW